MKRWALIGLLMVAGAVAVYGGIAYSETFSEVRERGDRIARGILSYEQFSTLMEFRKNHRDLFPKQMGKGEPGPKALLGLDLSGAQIDQILDRMTAHSGPIKEAMERVSNSAAALGNELLKGDGGSDILGNLSQDLGKHLGESGILVARLYQEIVPLLSPEQVEILKRVSDERDQRAQERIHQIPKILADLVGLWKELDLTSRQVDALSALHGQFRETFHRRHEDWLAGLRKDLRGILDQDQMALADRFHEEQEPGGKRFREVRREVRRELMKDLSLSAEQKIALMNVVVAKEEGIGGAAQAILQGARDLRKAAFAQTLDEAAVRSSASRLGQAIAGGAERVAHLLAEAKGVLTAQQMEVLSDHGRKRQGMLRDTLVQKPEKIRTVLAFLRDLHLSREQKDALQGLLSKTRQQRWQEIRAWHEEMAFRN